MFLGDLFNILSFGDDHRPTKTIDLKNVPA